MAQERRTAARCRLIAGAPREAPQNPISSKWGVRVSATYKERFDAKWLLDPTTGCHLWRGGRGESLSAPRLSWDLNIGEIPEGLMVLHKCNTSGCVNPDHLFLGTQSDHMDQMVRMNAKLTETEVLEIRDLCEARVMTNKLIAAYYHVRPGTISLIRHRRRWPDLEPRQ